MSRSASLSLAVFVALLLAVLATREGGDRVGLRTLELPQLAAGDITAIELTGPFVARLERADSGWTVADPEHPDARYAAESATVERLVAAIAKLSIAGFVSARPENHAELEIDDEAGLRLRVESAGGQGLDVVLGRRAQGGGDLIRLAGDGAVFESRTELAPLARMDVDAWRRRKLGSLEFAEIGSVTIERPGEAPLVLTRVVSESEKPPSWTLDAGGELPAGFVLDQGAAQRAAAGLASLQADGFYDEDPGPDVSGLGDSAVRAAAAAQTGERLAAVRFGAADAEGRVFTRIDGDAQGYLVARARADQIAPTLEALRDLALLRGDVAGVVKVVYADGAARTELHKQDGMWTLVDPPAGYDFDPARVDARVSVLTRTQGTRLLGAEEAARANFDDPLVIELTDADGTLRTIRFGSPLGSEPGAPPEVVVESSDGFLYAARALERERHATPLALFERVAPPPAGPGGGGLQGLESLPPDVRRQIEEQLRAQQGAR